jgi:selenocysteine insertion sequence-binding protein 2
MLGSLMSYQLRSKDDVNARSRRRLVLGFREVARGLRANKIKLVVLANNLDEYEAVGEKTQEVLDACQATGTPILFELSKRQLGKALGKTIKVSVVGVQNVDGAHEQFKKLKALAENISNVID